MEDPYSPYKAAHHADQLQAVRGGPHANPVHVQLILSDLCNQDCVFCAYRMEGYTSNQLFGKPDKTGRVNPNRMIDLSKAIEIIHDCAEMGVQAIQFTGGGEPTVHPDYIQLFELVSTLGMKWSLVTNGLKLFEKHLSTFLKASWIRVSLDAGQADTYAKIRRAKETDFDKVWDHIQKLCKAKKEVKNAPIVGIGYVVTPENWREVRKAAVRAKAVGVDNLRISAMFSPEDDKPFQELWDEASAECHLASLESGESFKVFNRFGERVEDLRQHNPDYTTCAYQRFTTYIGADLNVYRCCNTSYNERGYLGSVKNNSFFEMWFSAETQRQLTSFNAKSCDRCQFNSINKFINYILMDEPQHFEFV